MLDAIASAKHVLMLEMYLFESGRITTQFIDAFKEAAERGVSIYLLLDDFGSHGLSDLDRIRLVHKNITITYYNPLHYGKFRRNLFRDHRKIFIVDQQIAFVGGAGITDEFITTNPATPGWRETMIQIQGECIQDWISLFNEAWQVYSQQPLLLKDIDPDVQTQDKQSCRVVCATGRSRQGIKQSLIKRIRSSEQRVWLATAYFLPSFKVRRALIRAAKRGVDVRLLLPGEKSDHPAVRHAGRRFYYSLLKSGVKIMEYQPRFLHQKVILCDQWVSIGSSNIDRWNFRWNLEANQEVEDSRFAQQVVEMFEKDYLESQRCDLEDWERRAWHSRFLEWFWGGVDRFLDRYIR